MHYKDDLVSVIIPTYGRCEYLQRTVFSVLKQTYSNIEVIVVDDNGKSSLQGLETQKVMHTFIGNSKVKYLQHDINKNGSAARNTGLAASKGEYVAYLDDDDEFTPEKIQTQLAQLKTDTEYAASYCLNSKFYHGKRVQTTKYTKSGNCQFDVLCIKSDIHTSSLLMRKQSVIDMEGFDEAYARHQDYEFLIRFFEHNKIKCLPIDLLRIHVESEINRPNVDKLIAAKIVYFHKLDRIISKYTTNEKKAIYKAHNLELFRVCVKKLDKRLFKYIILAKPSFVDIKQYIYPVAVRYIRKLFPHRR